MPTFVRQIYHQAVRRYRALSIGKRMAILYLLSAVLPLMITNLYANRTLYGNAQATQIGAAERGYEQTWTHLNQTFRRFLKASDNIALDQTINLRLYRESGEADFTVQQIADMNSILAILTQKKDNLDISNVALYVGDELFYSHHADIITAISRVSGEDWYKQLTADNRQAVFYTQPDNDGNAVLTVARKVRNLQSLNEVKAIVSIDFQADEIISTLRQGCTVDGSVSLIAAADGTVIASSDPQIPEFDLSGIVREASSNRALEAYNDRYLIRCNLLENTDWYLVLIVSRQDMLLTNARAWLGVIAIMLAAMLPTVFLAKKMLNGITGRIKALGTHMQSVRMGRLEPTEADVNRDEIGVMIDDYNFMITRMQQLLDEQYTVGMEAQSAELRALQSQINPHFLYNTLDMVQWMARGNNTKEIRTVVKALANFYRLSLNKGMDIISLSDELDIINNYMIIQHLRFGDSVKLEIEIDEDILSCKLPKITLQPIIENALLHGILPKEDKQGLIRITGSYELDQVCIEITDNGVGTDLSSYEIVYMDANNGGYGQSGYGLYNIERRMRLIFGIRSCITLSSSIGRGTVVTLRFPVRR